MTITASKSLLSRGLDSEQHAKQSTSNLSNLGGTTLTTKNIRRTFTFKRNQFKTAS
jgi:hypothetical protein